MEKQIDELFDYFKTKCPNYMRHKYTSAKCDKCGMIDETHDPSWKYSDDGNEYYEKYMIIFLIRTCKKSIMSILNKITIETYGTLSDKFSKAVMDIKYIEQATEIADQLIKKIINEKFIALYAKLCKIIVDKKELYPDKEKSKKTTFQLILVKQLQLYYNKNLDEVGRKREMILLITFICELLKTDIIPKSVMINIINSLFKFIDHQDDKVVNDYYLEIICKLINNLSNYDSLIREYIEKLSDIRKAMIAKDRIYILILNLEEDYSKKWTRKRQNEVKQSVTRKFRKSKNFRRTTYVK